MSQPSPNYCSKVEKWVLCGVPLEKIITRPDQQLRALLVTEVYEHWIAAPHIEPRKMLQNFSRRKYAFLLRLAQEGDETAKAIVETCHITETSVRSQNEISNDVYLLNYLVGRLSTSKKHIQRLQFESNIEWMSNFGRKTGTWQAVKQANRDLSEINGGWKEETNPAEQLDAGAGFGITDDVSVVKADRVNYTDEEVVKYEKRYGITKKESAIIMEEQDGVYVPAEPDLDEEPDPDIFMEDQ